MQKKKKNKLKDCHNVTISNIKINLYFIQITFLYLHNWIAYSVWLLNSTLIFNECIFQSENHNIFTEIFSSKFHILISKLYQQFQEWKILYVLWWALLGHNLQHHDEKENAVLHSEPNHPVHGNLLSNCAHLLLTLRQWREGNYSTPSLFQLSYGLCLKSPILTLEPQK